MKYEAVTTDQLRAKLGRQCSPMAEAKGYVIGPDISGRLCHCSTHRSFADAMRKADYMNSGRTETYHGKTPNEIHDEEKRGES